MKRFALILTLFLFLLSCGRMKGEFAFKEPGGKAYLRKKPRLEFAVEKGVDWVYRLTSFPGGRRTIGVIVLKKEIGWVDILTTQDYVDPMKQLIYGNLSGFEPGDYKIVLVEVTSDGNEQIDEVELYLYSDEEVME